jgi:hypothetical protein
MGQKAGHIAGVGWGVLLGILVVVAIFQERRIEGPIENEPAGLAQDQIEVSPFHGDGGLLVVKHEVLMNRDLLPPEDRDD